jgi:hypothetical protein
MLYWFDLLLCFVPTDAVATNSDCAQHGGGLFCPDGTSALNVFSDVNVTTEALATL